MAFWNKRKPVEPIIPAVHVDWEAKFKLAATDLEGEVRERKRVQYDLARARLEIEALRPDAEAMRRKRQMDRDRAAGKRGKAA